VSLIRTKQSKVFATVFAVANLFICCQDNYERVGEEAATNIYPQGVAQNFTLTYTEAVKELSTKDSSNTRVVAILKSPINKDFDNLRFRYKEFPEGLQLDFYDDKGEKSVLSIAKPES